MRKYIIYSLIISVLFASCTSLLEEENSPIEHSSMDVFYASFENNDQTKALLGEYGQLLWQPNESISVYVDGASLGVFGASCSGPSTTTGFYQYDYESGKSAEVPETGQFIAVYPALSEDDFDLYGKYFSIKYPESISVGTSCPSGAFYSVAISNDHNLTFKHTSGVLRFTLSQENISKIVIKANNPNDALSGTARFQLDENGDPQVISFTQCSRELVVSPSGNGVFNSFFEVNKEYYISLPPGTYPDGLTFEFYTPYSTGIRTISKEVKINRAEIALLTNATKDVSFKYTEGNDDFHQYLYDLFGNISGSSGIYRSYVFGNNLCADDMFIAGADYYDYSDIAPINKFMYDASSPVLSDLYSKYLTFAQRANLFLNFSYGINETLDKQISEIRVLRAFCQMMLALGWHNPPIYLSNEANLPNSSYNDNLEWCAKECVSAAEYLPERESTTDKKGVWTVTKGFAQAVAGKAFLYNGKYSEAKNYLKKVIDSGKYALVPGERYWENFHIEGDGNEEKIFEHDIVDTWTNAWSSPSPYGFPIILQSPWMQTNVVCWRTDAFAASPIESYSQIASSGGGWGGLGVPQWFGDEFFANDGHSYRFDASLKHIDDAVYNMEYNEYYINSLTYEQKKNSTLVGIRNRLYGQSFWLPFKIITKSTDTRPGLGSNVDLTNFTFMRYAEVLLMYAEACLQLGDQTEAKGAINAIRARAGIKELENVNMDTLKKEKAFELWLEGTRWFDLVRWGDTERVEVVGRSIPTLYDKLFTNPSAGENVVWENEDKESSRFYTIYTDYGLDSGFKAGKHEYFPFPDEIMKNNSNLVQNPGW